MEKENKQQHQNETAQRSTAGAAGGDVDVVGSKKEGTFGLEDTQRPGLGTLDKLDPEPSDTQRPGLGTLDKLDPEPSDTQRPGLGTLDPRTVPWLEIPKVLCARLKMSCAPVLEKTPKLLAAFENYDPDTRCKILTTLVLRLSTVENLLKPTFNGKFELRTSWSGRATHPSYIAQSLAIAADPLQYGRTQTLASDAYIDLPVSWDPRPPVVDADDAAIERLRLAKISTRLDLSFLASRLANHWTPLEIMNEGTNYFDGSKPDRPTLLFAFCASNPDLTKYLDYLLPFAREEVSSCPEILQTEIGPWLRGENHDPLPLPIIPPRDHAIREIQRGCSPDAELIAKNSLIQLKKIMAKHAGTAGMAPIEDDIFAFPEN